MTKQQSKIIQGIAILLMIYHHFFLKPDELTPFISYGNIEVVRHLAWFGKICVGLFCFVSGYGLYCASNSLKKENVLELIKCEYKNMLYRILQLYIKFWFVLFVFMAMEGIFFEETYDLTGFVGNFTGVNTSYNGSWWYLFQYVEMLLIFPILDLLFTKFKNEKENKKRYLVCGIVAAIIIVLYFFTMLGELIRPAFLLVFVVGFMVARFDIYKRFIREIKLSIAVLMLVGAVAVRVLITNTASFALFDFVIVPAFCFGLLPIVEKCKTLGNILEWFGKIAVWLWLVHICVYDVTVVKFIAIADSLPGGHIPSVCFYLIQLGISTIVALVLDKLYRLVKK